MNYVVVDKEQLESDLTIVADSIRAKSGTTEDLAFPSGFKSVVESIDTSKEEQEKTIEITENGTTEVIPDEGKVLSKVTVNVEVESGGGSGEDTLTLLITKKIVEYEINEEVNLTANLFEECEELKKFRAPLLKTCGNSCFRYCYKLEIVDLGKIQSVNATILYACSGLKYVVLRHTSICPLSAKVNSSALNNGETLVLVPRALVEEYKVATNWTNYVNQFRALEDYTVDGTITGKLDESKI